MKTTTAYFLLWRCVALFSNEEGVFFDIFEPVLSATVNCFCINHQFDVNYQFLRS